MKINSIKKLVAIFLFSFLLPTNSSAQYLNDKDLERNFSEIDILRSNDKEYTKYKDPFVFFLKSNKNLAFYLNKDNLLYNYELTFIDDYSFNPIKTEKLGIPNNSILEFADENKVFYRHQLNFYTYEFSNQSIKRINNDQTTIFKFWPLNETSALCLGNISEPDSEQNDFGFFIYDFEKQVVLDKQKVLHRSKENNSLRNYLKYIGDFDINGDLISYNYDFYGKLVFFDSSKGEFRFEITTIDKVQPPQIAYFADTYTYKRGWTFFSNSGCFVRDDKLYVFSCRPNDLSKIIIDSYSIETKGYLQSYQVDFQNKNSSEIKFVSSSNKDNELILGFSNFFKGFNLNLEKIKLD